MDRPRASVSEADRAAMARQGEALAEAETDDEGTPEQRAAMIRAADARRAERGVAPLGEWWTAKSEPQFHEHARARGLLG